jgi:hypothetical protein
MNGNHMASNKIVFLTCHYKATVVSPALSQHGFELSTYDAFDTDSLGTFSGEKKRQLGQMDTALKKAQLACELTGSDFGLGSEGSFGPHPQVHLLPWNYEALTFWDSHNEHAIHAVYGTAETNFASQQVNSLEQAMAFAKQAQFPSHGLILGSHRDTFFQKGLQDESEFRDKVKSALQIQASVWLETDMRAHMNPTRMNVIGQAAQKLSSLLSSHCPTCQLPGYGLHKYIPGALCMTCGHPTRRPKAEQWHCLKCHHTEDKSLDCHVSAANCDFCNP